MSTGPVLIQGVFTVQQEVIGDLCVSLNMIGTAEVYRLLATKGINTANMRLDLVSCKRLAPSELEVIQVYDLETGLELLEEWLEAQTIEVHMGTRALMEALDSDLDPEPINEDFGTEVL